MGLFDIFLSPEKQIEKENKLLAKPNHTVAEVTAYNEYDREESYENENGETEWRTIREAAVTFRFKVNDQWHTVHLGPSEGYQGYYVGQQIIVKYNGNGITHFGRVLRSDSPNRI